MPARAWLQASRVSLLRPAGAGAAGREQLGPGGMGSPGVGLSRDGGTSPLPLPERGDPQAVQEQPRFLTPGCCLRRAVRSGQSGGPAPTSRDSVRRGPAPRVFKLQPLMYPRLPVPLERETPGAAVTDLSAGGRWGWRSGRARSAGGP